MKSIHFKNKIPSEQDIRLLKCHDVLRKKEWGKVLVGNKLRSQDWWKRKKEELINAPTIYIDPKDNLNPGIYDCNGQLEIPPIPFEIEMGLDDKYSSQWLSWVQAAFKKI